MELDAPPGTQHWTTTLFSTLTDSFQNFQWIDFTIMLLLHLMPQQTVYPGPSLSTAAQLQPPLFSTGQWSWQELFPCILLAWGQYLMQRDPLPKKKKNHLTVVAGQFWASYHTCTETRSVQTIQKQICAFLLDPVVFPFVILLFFPPALNFRWVPLCEQANCYCSL